MNERLRRLKPYPKTRLDQRKAELRSRGVRLFDFGTGDPCEPTPELVRQALIDAVPPRGQYSQVQGTDELRAAAAEFLERRFRVAVDPQTQVLATAGSMEAIFHLPMILVDASSGRDRVVYGEPAYPVFEIGTYFAEAEPHPVPLTAESSYLFGPEDVGADVLARTAIVLLNYPNNPTGQVMPAEYFERWVAARDEYGFAIVSDECYVDIYFEDPPRSLLEFGTTGCLAVHSLSKRSGMTGYQTGFLAGDPDVVATLRRFRASMGVSTPLWTQAAATAAWSDQGHVEERRAAFAEKRRILLEILAARGVDVYPSTATIFLWARVPEGTTDIDYAERLLDVGIIVSPGSFYGPSQDRFVRLALSPSIDECQQVAELWPE